MSSDFKKYLTEATKQYDFVIKVAGDLDEGFADKLESALGKFDVANITAGKKTPIQSLPLDYPNLKNTEVTVYETTLNYPTTPLELRAYIAEVMGVNNDLIRVRIPGEPYEQYQSEKENKPYESKLMDGEYKDAEDVDKDAVVTTEKGKETFIQSLAKEAKDRFKEEA